MRRFVSSAAPGFAVAACLAMSAARATDDDAALNAAYRSLMSKLDASGEARLREAQRAWIAFRDKECAFRASDAECVADLTRARTRELDAALASAGRATTSNATVTSNAGLDVPCATSAGGAKAAKLVDECLEVSPATHPPCNASNACALIVDEITRGCAMIDKGAPTFCADYAKTKR